VVVAGTHGKTTTTSMASWVAECAGIKAGYLIGGIPLNYNRSFRPPQDPWFIIEGDEYDTAFFDKVPKFVHYRPKHVILSSIEFDHADIYRDLDHVKSAFQKLLELIPEDGTLVYYAEDENIRSLLKHTRCRQLISYGIDDGDYRAVERMTISGRNHFCVEHQGSKEADVALKLFGVHNTLNALAVFALARHLKWDLTGSLQGLSSFLGVKRRQEVIGEPRGIRLIEDFAHHPTAVKLTVESMKEQYPDRRIIAVFEPRSATSRRKIFQKDYAEAFGKADAVVIAEAFDQSKIPEGDRFSSEQLVNDIKAKGTPAQLGHSTDEMIQMLKSTARPQDVVLLMSNGGFGGIYAKLIKELE
jgi:UDP-N-acetylmuramate: L-alanyl-gamma-D-glutamyl-meso-diaminopimelate ligase